MKNNNHGVDTSDFTRNFTPEEVSDLIQSNVWDDICAEQRKNRSRLNNNDDGDIISRVNSLVPTIETLQDTVSRIRDDHTDNGGGKYNSGGNNIGEKIHRMAMMAEKIDIIAATSVAVQEDVDHYLI